MLISFLLNTCVMVVFCKTEKATDKQWFRIRAFNIVCIALQVIFGIINIINIA